MKEHDDYNVTFDDVECTGETEMAICCLGLLDNPVWIPKSQIHDDSEVWKKGQTGALVITRWIAEQKGLV